MRLTHNFDIVRALDYAYASPGILAPRIGVAAHHI